MNYFPRRKELVSSLKIRLRNLLLNLGGESVLPFHAAKIILGVVLRHITQILPV